MTSQRTSVEGTARDAKGGAVIVSDAGVVYVFGLDAWPDALSGKRVRATGVLREEKLLPEPVAGPRGEVSAGAEGTQLVLREARWEAAPSGDRAP